MDGDSRSVSGAQQRAPLWVVSLGSRLQFHFYYNDTHGLVASLHDSTERLAVIYLTRIFEALFVNRAE